MKWLLAQCFVSFEFICITYTYTAAGYPISDVCAAPIDRGVASNSDHRLTHTGTPTLGSGAISVNVRAQGRVVKS